jgi:organic hydroperoxide reductase OsmC/OhrA
MLMEAPRTKRPGRSFYLPATCRKLESVPPVVKAIRARRMQKDQLQAGHTKLEELAAKAKAGCPVSKLLNANITLDATLID